MSLGPFDLTGGPFLQLYCALFALTIVAGFLIPRWLRPEGRAPRGPDVDALAYLAGGTARFSDTVVARLLAARRLAMVGRDKFAPDRNGAGGTAAERSVLALSAPVGWPAIARALSAHAKPIERRLIADGLMIDARTALQMRFFQTLPYLLLLGFGAIKWEVGTMRDRPVGFLTLLLIATAVFALIRWVAVDRKTRGGHRALDEARAGAQRLRRGPPANEADLGVALFGTAVLAGSGLSGFHQMRSTTSDGGSSGGDSGGGDGGGGCGGGGGGGCGGCGS